MIITTTNPATEETIATYPGMSSDEVTKIIDESHRAFLCWSHKSIVELAQHFMQLGEILLANKKRYAELITTEMGKPIKSAIAEIEKCAFTCQHFAENTANYLTPRSVKTEMSKSFVTYAPLGIIFAIMPWNFPFWQVFRFAVPSLMAGNSALLKHAPITTGCGLEIEKIFRQAGFPENLFRTLVIENELVPTIINNSKIAATTLTGSIKTGKTVGALSAGSLKKIVLELGGNDPYLILEDADLELAAEAVLTSRLSNSGQSCIAAKRILAVRKIREKFQSIILEKIEKYTIGNPMDPNIHLGPLARKDLRDNLHRQIEDSVKKGAKILKGGVVPERRGFYYPPTLLINIKKGMPAYEEELFGPVITFIDTEDEKEAIQIANSTDFGLGAAIFTQDIQRGEHLAIHEIHAGTVFVNDFVRSDPRLPFGGIKNSGFGRELSLEGIHEFVNIKTIGIK